VDGPKVWQPTLPLMQQADVERLHHTATTILETTGLNVHHPGMRSRLAAAGARLGESPRTYIPRGMVEQALRTAKRDIVIHNRLGQPVLSLGPRQIYFGTGSDLIYMYDVETGERRPSVLEDVGRAARI
jgi:trimethylamine--corrinoid protein Co-methyltransferase